MIVRLLRHTADPVQTVALASRLCYSPVGIAELEEGLSARKAEKLIDKIMALGHFSVLEHAVFTFGIEGLSRAASHQLVRHRLASYSQQSQRYVEAGEGFEHVLPPSIGRNEALRRRFGAHMRAVGRFYAELVAAGIPAEDARFVLPNAAATKIIVTMNARELRHFFRLRCCRRAQWEIRAAAEVMLGHARRAADRLFVKAGPGCVGGRCPEGKMSCGRSKEVRKAYREWTLEEDRPPLNEEGGSGRSAE